MTLFNRIFKRDYEPKPIELTADQQEAKQDYQAWLDYYKNPEHIKAIEADEDEQEKDLPLKEREAYIYAPAQVAKKIAQKMLDNPDYKAAIDKLQEQSAHLPDYQDKMETQPHRYYAMQLQFNATQELRYLAKYSYEPTKIVEPQHYLQANEMMSIYQDAQKQLADPVSEFSQKYSKDMQTQMQLHLDKALPALKALVEQVSTEQLKAFEYNMSLEDYQGFKKLFEQQYPVEPIQTSEEAETLKDLASELLAEREMLRQDIAQLDKEDIDYESHEYGIQSNILKIDVQHQALTQAIEDFQQEITQESDYQHTM